MNRADEHATYEELAVGHALSALEPEDEQQFLQHLAGCARCERDVVEHRATLALLAFAADPVEPPASLWDGIRAELRPGASGQEPAHEGVTSLAAARERRTTRTATAARWAPVAAAAAMVVALGAWNVSLRADRSAEQERSDRFASAVLDLARPDSRRVPLVAENGSVVAVAVVHDRSMTLVLDGLAPNPDDTSYVLWTQDPQGDLRPVQAFDVSGDEVDVVDGLPVDEGIGGLAALAVSREQGSTAPPQPLGPVVASGSV